jgi:predicted aspartyl protease
MITGVMTASAALIAVQLQGVNGQVEAVEAIVDTGFNGFLTLALPQIARLGFPYEGNMEATLGDGSDTLMDMFSGAVVWHGHLREGTVLAADGPPLVGLELLRGSRWKSPMAASSLLSRCRKGARNGKAGKTPDSALLHPGYLAISDYHLYGQLSQS